MSIKENFIDCFSPERVQEIRCIEKVPKLSPDISYSTGNFSMLRENHARLQLDSINGTNHRLRTILDRTNWPKYYFKDKLILECGCGAGPDTEILLKLGARVFSIDITGLDVAYKNIGKNSKSQLLQASLLDLPLKKNYFDIVFCHRVLQHTPNPDLVLSEILKYVKKGGGVFVHSYARSLFQMMRWKYFFRVVTKRINPMLLYKIIKSTAPYLFFITNKLHSFGKIGIAIEHFFVPFLNYRQVEFFKEMSDDWIIEYGIHDTFDALSPKYDKPLSIKKFKKIANQELIKKGISYEIIDGKSITLLRNKPI